MWDWAAKNKPKNLEEFAFAMSSLHISAVLEDYDWITLTKDALIVDVGGGAHFNLNHFPNQQYR
jgi:hypothetical protein